MSEARQERLAELLRRQRRSERVPALVEEWSDLGVSVSPLSDDRQIDLLQRLRNARTWSLRVGGDVKNVVREFTQPLDMVVIVDWQINEEPAVLVSAEALIRSVGRLREIYRDGFLLLDQPLTSVLIVDIDEDEESLNIDQIELVANAQD